MALFPLRRRTIVASVCLGAGTLLLVLLTFFLPVWVDLSCQRTSTASNGPVHCQLRGASFVRIPWKNRRIENVVGAELNLQTFRPGWIYRVFLYTYEDEIPIASYSVRYQKAEPVRRQLKDFLETDFSIAQLDAESSLTSSIPSTLKLSYGPPWGPFLAAFAFGLCLSGVGRFLLWLDTGS